MSQITFNKTTYTNADLFEMKGRDLVALHNALAKKAKVPETKRFATIGSGVSRTWKLLEQVGEVEKSAPKAKAVAGTGPVASLGGSAPAKVKKTPKAKTSEGSVGGARRGTNLAAPGHAPLPCREGSKQAVLLDKLARPMGATMPELLDALQYGKKPWTEATVRSGFGWDMKQKGYGVRSEFKDDGREVFYIVVPVIKGQPAAIPAHTPLKGKPKADARQAKLKV